MKYSERSDDNVDPFNFAEFGHLTLSKFIFGSGSGNSDPNTDFKLYCALKYAIMSGGVNHIDTSHTFRRHRSELVVGKVLHTLIEKYGLEREEVFINSKLMAFS